MPNYPQLDLTKLKTMPLRKRKSKVAAADVGRPFPEGGSFSQFLEGLPNILAGKDFREVVEAVAQTLRRKRPVVFALGAHVIKVGLSPVIIDLINRDVISLIAMNGAGLIHDLEMALTGKTSEDVEEELKEGRFGMAAETAEFLNSAINSGVKSGLGLGASVGAAMLKQSLPFSSLSLVLAATKKRIPLTCHVALGTDIIHFHPSADGAATGEGSMRDFKTFASVIARLNGGVYFNVGSAVLLPEVFLKALTLARNLGFAVNRITTVNMDFIRHYRPEMNVVKRPTASGGKGYSLVGHHEINLPLLAAAIKERVHPERDSS